MSTTINAKSKAQSNLIVLGLGLLIVTLGSTILTDWYFDLDLWSSLFPQFQFTKPITAFCFVLCGITLIIESFYIHKTTRIIVQILSICIIFMATFSLIQLVSNWSVSSHLSADGLTHILKLFDPGQMPPSTSFCFILIGIAFFIQPESMQLRLKVPILYSLISVILTIGILVILGYLSEYFFKFHLWDYAGVAIQTPVFFILIGLSLYFLTKKQYVFVWSLDNLTAIGFSLAIFTLLIISSLSEHSLRNMQIHAYKVSIIEDILNQVGELQSDFLNYLTSERIYIITGDESLLKKQQSTKEQLIKNMNELRALVINHPKINELFVQAEPLIYKKINLINEIIQVRKNKGLKAATELIIASNNIQLSDDITDKFSMIRSEAYLNLRQSLKLEEALSIKTFQLLPIGIFSSLTFLFLAVFFLNMRVTEKKAALDQKRVLENQLRQSQKMEAIGQLTGGIAHDFNNLLGIIIGNLDLLEEELENNESCAKKVKTASNAALRGAEITKRLLSFSRFQQLNPSAVSLNTSINNAITLVSHALGPDIKIIQKLDESLPPVFVDEAEFENVLVNLSVNARDAMPQGGTLIFHTELKTLEEDYPAVQMKELRSGPYACVTVSDTGVGMSSEVIEKAFEPFFTTKPVGKGTGLGLAMVYGFAKQSGGYARIYSEVNQGTSITLYLPFAEKTKAIKKEVNEISNLKFKGMALVVDDEPDLQDIAAAYLKGIGFEVLQANNAGQALEILHENSKIALLVTDIIMPKMNGIELASVAKKENPNLIVVYSSGFHEQALSEKLDKKLDAPLIRKPYQKKDFIAIISNVMTLASSSNALKDK